MQLKIQIWYIRDKVFNLRDWTFCQRNILAIVVTVWLVCRVPLSLFPSVHPPVSFFFFCNFLKFSYFGLLGEEKLKKLPKMKNSYIRYTPYVRNLIAYDYHFWYTCAKLWLLRKDWKNRILPTGMYCWTITNRYNKNYRLKIKDKYKI